MLQVITVTYLNTSEIVMVYNDRTFIVFLLFFLLQYRYILFSQQPAIHQMHDSFHNAKYQPIRAVNHKSYFVGFRFSNKRDIFVVAYQVLSLLLFYINNIIFGISVMITIRANRTRNSYTLFNNTCCNHISCFYNNSCPFIRINCNYFWL